MKQLSALIGVAMALTLCMGASEAPATIQTQVTDQYGNPTGNPPNFAPEGPISVGSTATIVVAARVGRGTVTVVNEGTVAVRCGGPNVTFAGGTGSTGGVLIPGVAGASFTFPTSAAVSCVVSTGTEPVSEVETY